MSIDEGIADVVRVFNDAGLETIASCQGHGEEDAWVVLPCRQGTDPEELLRDVMQVVHRHGWESACIIALEYEMSGARERWVKVRWWGRVPYR